MNRFYSSLTLIALMTLASGCANQEGVAPSQNSSLNTVSPSGTAISEGGSMQRSLDTWLKEEWAPLTTVPSQKEEQSIQSAAQEEGNASFGLQKYADKWKAYHEKKDKMNEGKPKEASNIEKIQSMPVIGK